MSRNNNNGGKGGKGFMPKAGQTRMMSCSICIRHRKLRQTWHSYVMPFIGSNYWKCNTCGN